jgi:hypothetical protein
LLAEGRAFVPIGVFSDGILSNPPMKQRAARVRRHRLI